MTPRLLCLLLLAGCAGPAAHLAAQAGSALEPGSPEAARPPVASTLAPADPLGAPFCGLPTAPGSPCPAPEEEPTKPAEDPHRHHHGTAPAPAPEKPAEDPHQHHRPAAAKSPAPVPAMVIDPVCKMKIDPTTAKGGSLLLDGQRHHFCSSSCRNTFKSQNPGAK